jgi:type IV secretion system protein VirB1
MGILMGVSFIIGGLLALSSLCIQCGPDVHPATTQAIIEVESAGNPLAIHDNETGKSYSPATPDKAAAIAAHLLAQGHSLDMGLMQINSQHLKKKSINYARLFDPCFNIQTGTRILADFYRHHSRNNPKDPPDLILLKSLSSYNTGTPYQGKHYVNKILKRAGFKTDAAMLAAHTEVKPGRKQNTITFFRNEGPR